MRKIHTQNKNKGNKIKAKLMKPIKLLKTLNMNQFKASWSSDFIYRDLQLENLTKNRKIRQKIPRHGQSLIL